jgi:hypothetical protein
MTVSDYADSFFDKGPRIETGGGSCARGESGGA